MKTPLKPTRRSREERLAALIKLSKTSTAKPKLAEPTRV